MEHMTKHLFYESEIHCVGQELSVIQNYFIHSVSVIKLIPTFSAIQDTGKTPFRQINHHRKNFSMHLISSDDCIQHKLYEEDIMDARMQRSPSACIGRKSKQMKTDSRG